MNALCLAVLLLAAGERYPAIGDFPVSEIRAHDLMSDTVFMRAHWGMRIHAVAESGDGIVVTTTGASFTFDSSRGEINCAQRLGGQRQSVTLRLPVDRLAGLKVTSQGSGGVVLESKMGTLVKVNCDSLLMLRGGPMQLKAQLHWKPVTRYAHGASHISMDPDGAVGFYPIRNATGDNRLDEYRLDADGELWIAIGPPRPYRWDDSYRHRLIWQGSWTKPQLAVPSDAKIEKWAAHGNILWLQSENMLWKSWHKAFEPRLPGEFQRVIDTAHRLGQKVQAYASPFYFTGGIGGTQTGTGENVGQYLVALEDLLKRYPGIDSVYFDGIYPASVENTYRVCRAVRAMIGDEKMLMIHNTTSAPGGRCFNPAADTWADILLRGEGRGFISEEWLRYYVSCYNISNAVGVVCNNAGFWIPTQQQIEMTLRANCRLAYMPFDADEWPNGKLVRIVKIRPEQVERRHREAMSAWYWPRLGSEHRAWFEKINRQGDFKLPPPPPDPPPHPLAGLTLADVQHAVAARLIVDSFGADGPKYRSPVTINGVAVGDLPPSSGDEWTQRTALSLPAAAVQVLKNKNQLVIANPKRDCFKLRNIYLEFDLADGRKASSHLISRVHCSDDGWLHREGESVAIGDDLVIALPLPVKR